RFRFERPQPEFCCFEQHARLADHFHEPQRASGQRHTALTRCTGPGVCRRRQTVIVGASLRIHDPYDAFMILTKGPKMKRALTAFLLLSAAGNLQAKDKPAYEKGVLLQMDSSSCGYAEKDNKTIAGEILGTDAQHKKTQEVLCQEYILKTDRLIYRIRPK